ncbi:MAG: DedA family protein [Sphaerochaetaceae bacterium]|jgi:membrane protein DedA with SNARE-associated domain
MLDQLLAFIVADSYFALLIIAFLASALNIAPASPSLIAAGSLIAFGQLDYSLVFWFSLMGSILGDLLAYGLALRYGREVLMRFGFRRLLNSTKFLQIERFFTKNSSQTIFISRFFLTSFGPVVNLAAGLAKTDYKKFVICSLAGQIIYVFLLTGIGYFGVRHWQYISNLYGYLASILLVAAIYWLYRRFFSRAVV